MADTKATAEALIPLFKFERLLNQDQSGRRVSLLGTISSQPALLVLERSALPTDPAQIEGLVQSIRGTANLGANDIYHWYLASHDVGSPSLKLNLIYPCGPGHVAKYSAQRLHNVVETAAIYARHVEPWIARQLDAGRLNWVYNILDGRTEQEDVIFRTPPPAASGGDEPDNEGFLLLPDLNWDRKTLTSLHVLALVFRRDLRSLRDLTVAHIPFLRRLRARVVRATAATYGLDGDQLKLYLHYQPTYYHFHVHVVHVAFDGNGGTQSVGKAWGLEAVVGWLESMRRGRQQGSGGGGGEEWEEEEEEPGMRDVELVYTLGERSELWGQVFSKLSSEDQSPSPPLAS